MLICEIVFYRCGADAAKRWCSNANWWCSSGERISKVEPGESPEAALIREIKEELDADITVTSLLTTVEYDYPDFHLSMDCFMAYLNKGSELKLKEHEAARWLLRDELDSIDWLPADIEAVKALSAYYS